VEQYVAAVPQTIAVAPNFEKAHNNHPPNGFPRFVVMTTPELNSPPPSGPSSSANDDLKLQVATQYCTKGRQSWSQGDQTMALSDFRHALLILETLLGGQHVLVAQLYHWMGLILQEQLDHQRAEQCFVKYLRIRNALQSEKGGTPTDSTVMEAQVSLSNIWQGRGISSSRSFEMIHNLQESVRLEHEGDVLLLGEASDMSSLLPRPQALPNYLVAMKMYQQAMHAFPDEHHEGIMSKMAMCYHRAKESGAGSTHNISRAYLDQAIVWYRMALKVFCTSTRFPESMIDPHSSNQSLMTSHPEYQRLQRHLEKVLHDYFVFDLAKIKEFIEHGSIRKSVLHQHAAERKLSLPPNIDNPEALNDPKKATARSPSLDDLANARRHYQEALAIERNLYQHLENKDHMVVSTLQKELSSLDQRYIAQLEEERDVSRERLSLLEHQSDDWISTVRHQEDQLRKLQSSLQNREGHAAEALNAAASKEAELVGWKRKFETMQAEWKETQKRVQTLETEKATVQQQLKLSESKASQLEYTFKKQALDFQNLEEMIRRKTKEVEEWKDQYQASRQAQNHSQQQCERAQAAERELQAQIKDLQSQNVVLRDWNKELQAEQQLRSRSIPDSSSNDELQKMRAAIHGLQSKLKEVTNTKDRAIKKLKKYHHQRQQQQGGAEEATEVIIFLEDKVQVLEGEKARLEKLVREKSRLTPGDAQKHKAPKSNAASPTDDIGQADNLAARLEKSNNALATLHAEHRAKLAELDNLEKSKIELEKSVADSQEIIALLKKANAERGERCDELKAENDRLRSQVNGADSLLSRSLDLGDIATPNRLDTETSNMLIDQIADLELQNEELREQVDKTTDDNKMLAVAVKSLKAKLEGTNDFTKIGDGQTKTVGAVLDRRMPGDTDMSTTGDTENLEKRLNEAEKANDELAAMVEKMRTQIKELTSLDRDDSSGRSSVRATVLETELREAKLHIESLTANAKALQKSSEASKKFVEEKQALEARTKALEEDLEKSATKEQKLSEKLKEATEKLKATRKEVEEKDSILLRLQSLEKDLEETSSHRQKLLSENTSFKSQLDLARDAIEEKNHLATRLTQLEAEKKKSEEESQSLRSQIEGMKTKEASTSPMDHHLERLEGEIALLKENLLTAQKKNRSLSKEVASYRDQLKSSTHGVQEENIRLLEQVYSLETELNSAKEMVKDVRAELQAGKQALQDRCSALEEALGRSKEQNEALSSEISDPLKEAEEDRQQFKERCVSLEKRLHEALALNQKITTQADQNSKGLAEMLAKESQEQQRLVNERAKLEKQLHESQEQNERFATQVATLSHQLTELQSQLDTIESDHLDEQDELLKRCHELEQKLQLNLDGNPARDSSVDQEKLADLEKEVQDLTEKNANLEGEVALYQKKIETATDGDPNTEELRDRCAALEQELLETVEQNEELTKQVHALGTRVRDLESYAEKTASELEAANGMIQTLEAREAPGDDDFGRLLERCTDLEAEKSSIEYELKQLKNGSAELEEIRKERDDLQQELDAALADLIDLQQMQGTPSSAANNDIANDQLNERLEALADAKDELKKLLDEAVEENAELVRTQKKMSEIAKKAQQDRDEIDSLYQQAKLEVAEAKSQMIAFEELLKESKMEGEELARRLEIEKQVLSSLKAAANSGPDDENELEDLYRQAREEMKELEEMLMEAEEQIEHLKTKCSKLEQKTELSRQDLIDTELSSETVHSLNGLSRDELIKENRKVLHKLQEARTHSIDQQENITILQAQLRDALKFHQSRGASPRKSNGNGGGFGGFWNRGKKEPPKQAEEGVEEPQDTSKEESVK
jgi:chromosome segregation ATPase